MTNPPDDFVEEFASNDPGVEPFVTGRVLNKRITGVEFDPGMVSLHLENGVILRFTLGHGGQFMIQTPTPMPGKVQ